MLTRRPVSTVVMQKDALEAAFEEALVPIPTRAGHGCTADAGCAMPSCSDGGEPAHAGREEARQAAESHAGDPLYGTDSIGVDGSALDGNAATLPSANLECTTDVKHPPACAAESSRSGGSQARRSKPQRQPPKSIAKQAAALAPEPPARRVLVLDFASDSNPGGGARSDQRGTQEEGLCRQSSLLLALEALEYPIPAEGVAFVENVVVFRQGEQTSYSFRDAPFEVSVVASAMPSLSGCDRAEELARRKIAQVLHLARCYDSVVLGAWGCGAFGNSADDMALWFQREIFKAFGCSKKPSKQAVAETPPADEARCELRIVFAVLGAKHTKAFEGVFGRELQTFHPKY